MTEDIWIKKPKYRMGIDASDFTYKYYSGVEMDAWLDELKAEYDAIDKLNAMLWEKAEKFDELVKTEPSEALLARMDDCRRAEDKLEAVKAHLEAVSKTENEFFPWSISDIDFNRLMKNLYEILEAE